MARLRLEDLPPETVDQLRASGQLPPDTPDDPGVVSDDPAPAPRQGPAPRSRRRSRSPLDRVPHTGPTSTGAGFILGLIAWAVARSYINEGPAGVRRWMRAKFLNRVEP